VLSISLSPKDWLEKHDISPVGAPGYQHGIVQRQSFLNYTVNNSVVSHESGDHIGEKMSISSLVGREGIKAHAAWAAGLLGGALSETPLLGKAAGMAYGINERWISGIANAANVAGDASDRHDMSRIVRLFQKAVENGRELPYQFGDAAEPSRSDRTAPDPRQPGHADHAMYEQIKDGVAKSHQEQGRPFDEGGERIAVSLLVAAKQAGLDRVDHVVASVGANPGGTSKPEPDPRASSKQWPARDLIDVRIAVCAPPHRCDESSFIAFIEPKPPISCAMPAGLTRTQRISARNAKPRRRGASATSTRHTRWRAGQANLRK
jgi:hypothetical protein